MLLPPPLRAGQTLDPESLYAKTWPGKPSLVKLKDNLILQTPPQFEKFWAQRDPYTGSDLMARPPMSLDKIPLISNAGFVMHTPDFEGYRPDNYLNKFDEDEVLVYQIQPASMSAMDPDAPGAYPKNVFNRISQGPYRDIDPSIYEEKYGLRCYSTKRVHTGLQRCYGRRDSEIEEYLILDVISQPYTVEVVYPTITTHYFTPKYGGLEIAWRAHVKNLPHWRAIDSQIWRYIDSWNIAPQSATTNARLIPSAK